MIEGFDKLARELSNLGCSSVRTKCRILGFDKSNQVCKWRVDEDWTGSSSTEESLVHELIMRLQHCTSCKHCAGLYKQVCCKSDTRSHQHAG